MRLAFLFWGGCDAAGRMGNPSLVECEAITR